MVHVAVSLFGDKIAVELAVFFIRQEVPSLLADGATPAVVQRQLRHSDARITLGIYGHVVGDQQRVVVENRSARIAKYAVS